MSDEYQIKLMVRSVNGWVTFLNLSVEEGIFKEVVWRALVILKRANPNFHFEVYSEGKKLTDGGDVLHVGEEERN